MAAKKAPSKGAPSKSAPAAKKGGGKVKIKDLSPRKNPKGGDTDHGPHGGGVKSDY